MAVNISQRTAQIRTAVHGKDVRENLAGGLEDIVAAENQFETDMFNQETTYQKTLEQRQKDFENAQRQEQADYETKINGEFDAYKTAITKQENDFETAQKQEQADFETAQKQEQSNYESKLNSEFNDYKSDINKRQEDFEASQKQEQSDYEVKVNSEWSDYKKVMDADEAERKVNETARQNNEAARISNENIRIENENVRKQNEIIRQDNEADRKNNEVARETAFAGMQHVDANLEISTARGTFENLNARLNNSEGETLANKELITIQHDLNCYPNVRCICGYYGAGMAVIGDDSPAGADSYLVNIKIGYPDTSKVKIYVPSNYLIKSPLVQKLDTNKYLIASNNSTETKSILITIQEVA